ncbi:MAG: exosortase/archaeosortase family protein [Candidatus Acidiferrales bacterium]
MAALVILLYGDILKALVQNWWTDPDYGHGFFVVPFSAFVLWRSRRRWMKTEIKPNNFGLIVMLGAIALLFLGSLGAELFTSRFSMLVLLAGMVIFLAGWKFVRAIWFPLGFLVFMIPLPVIIYNEVAFPLQLITSRFAAFLLGLAQVPVLRDGNILRFSNYSLGVVQACSGIRSLISLIVLAVIYLHFTEPRRWARYFLIALAVPIAIISNAVRIMVAGMMAHRFGPAAAEGFLHGFSGVVIFSASLTLILTCHLVLNRLGSALRGAAHA